MNRRTMQRLSEQEHQLDLTSTEAGSVLKSNLRQECRSCKRSFVPYRSVHLYGGAGAQAGEGIFASETCCKICKGWCDPVEHETRGFSEILAYQNSAGLRFHWGSYENATTAYAGSGICQPQLERGQFKANPFDSMMVKRKGDMKEQWQTHSTVPQVQGPVKKGLDTQAQITEYQAFLASRSADFRKEADDIRKEHY